jgi:hypothetical protein
MDLSHRGILKRIRELLIEQIHGILMMTLLWIGVNPKSIHRER